MTPSKEIFLILKSHGVQFVVVGGHAVNFHGYVRLTEDTDIAWMRSPENERRLLGALTDLEAVYIGKEIDRTTGIERVYPVTLGYIQANHLMMLSTRKGFFDLFDYIPGFPAEDVMRLWDTSLDDEGIRYASLDWLRRMKKASGRTKDLLDLENLPQP